MKYSIVSLEDGIACLESAGNRIYVDSVKLPVDAKEGDILNLDGNKYVVDNNSTSERRAEVFDKYKRIFKTNKK